MKSHGGHDLYVSEAHHAVHPTHPRVLLRCVRCSRLGIGMIETEGDRNYAATKDRQFDTGEWWHFDDLRIIGSLAAECPCVHHNL